MAIYESLKKRRTYYGLNKELPVSVEEVKKTVEEVTRLVPDAFDMKSARVVTVFGEKQDELWNRIFEVFGGNVPREKIDGFKAAAGTVLYFYDEDVIKALQEKFSLYADNFPVWANQANGMLQISIWTALRDLGIGANLQHYNPVIDDAVKQMLNLPNSWKLIAQMPFGGIVAKPDAKATENIENRVKFF